MKTNKTNEELKKLGFHKSMFSNTWYKTKRDDKRETTIFIDDTSREILADYGGTNDFMKLLINEVVE